MYYAPPHAAYAPDAPPPPPPPFYYGAPMPPAYYEPPEPPFVARRRDQPMHAGQGCVKRARWGAQHRIHEHFADGFPDLARRFVKVRASSDRRFEYDLGTRRFPSKRLGAIGVRHLNALFRRLDRAIGTRDASLVHELRAMLTDVLEDWRFRHHWRAGGGGGGDDDGASDASSDAEDDDADAPPRPPPTPEDEAEAAAHLRAERIAVALVKILYAQEAPPAAASPGPSRPPTPPGGAAGPAVLDLAGDEAPATAGCDAAAPIDLAVDDGRRPARRRRHRGDASTTHRRAARPGTR